MFVFYFSLVIAPSVWEAFQAAMVAGLFIVLLGGGSFLGLLYILWIYRGSGVRRIFSISPKGIKIVVPRQPVFEVSWSEFDLIQIHKHTGSHNNNDYRLYMPRLTQGRLCVNHETIPLVSLLFIDFFARASPCVAATPRQLFGRLALFLL